MTVLPQHLYRDPLLILMEREAEAERRKNRPKGICKLNPFGEVVMGSIVAMTREESDDVEELLGVWFRWCRSYKAVKGHARVASSCQGHQHEGDDDDDVVDARIEAEQAKVVDACMDSLSGIQRGVVGVVQANRSAGNDVFRYPRLTRDEQLAEYQRAKIELMPHLRAKGMAVGERRAVA